MEYNNKELSFKKYVSDRKDITMNVAFVTDSSCGLAPDEMMKEGIYCIPLQIVFMDQDKTLLDFVETTNKEVYQLIRNGQRMTTSLPPLGLIENTFEEIKNKGFDTVFCIGINPGLSSAYNAYRLAAENIGLKFMHIDIYTTSCMQKYCISLANKLYHEGVALEEIIEKIKNIAETGMTLVLPSDLDHLRRGGRLTPMAATLAGLLKIKPILKIDKTCLGKIDIFDKIRTYNRAVDRMVKELVERGVDDSYAIYVANSDDLEQAIHVKEQLQLQFPNHDIQICDLVSVISVHTGCGCIGIQAFKK